MKVTELNEMQKAELMERYANDCYKAPSDYMPGVLEELVDQEYAETEFADDDFFCTVNIESIPNLINEVEQMEKNIENTQDADTVLADLMEDFEISGIADEIFEFYRKTTDKPAFLQFFELITGVKFQNYLIMSKNAMR